MGRRKSAASLSPRHVGLPPINPVIDGAESGLTDCEYDDTELLRAHEQPMSQFLAQSTSAPPSTSSHATRSAPLAPAFDVAPLPSSSKPVVPRKKRKAVHDTDEVQRSPKRARKSVGNATPTARAVAKHRVSRAYLVVDCADVRPARLRSWGDPVVEHVVSHRHIHLRVCLCSSRQGR